MNQHLRINKIADIWFNLDDNLDNYDHLIVEYLNCYKTFTIILGWDLLPKIYLAKIPSQFL